MMLQGIVRVVVSFLLWEKKGCREYSPKNRGKDQNWALGLCRILSPPLFLFEEKKLLRGIKNIIKWLS